MLEFVLQNWYLFLALGLISAMIMFEPLRNRTGGIRKIGTMELTRLVSHESAAVIDVSTEAEFKAGHINGSINTPLADMGSYFKRLQKYKSKPMVVVCQVGNRSTGGANKLKKAEFEKLYVLNGGLAAWRKDSLPLEKG